MLRRPLGLLVAVTLLAGSAAVAGPASAQPAAVAQATAPRPMVFVHGGLGSAQQFEAQALRFASNGFPADHIEMFEHNSLTWPSAADDSEQAQQTRQERWGRLDQLVAELQDRTGAAQVNLLGHSQGTGFLQGYLNSSPERAADVAQYVNLDGGSGGTVPGEVETLAIWGEGNPDRQIPGAVNVQFADQSHTEVVNSPETFAEIYEFFLGAEPQFTEVVREPTDQIEVSGRVQLFPQNVGAEGRTLNIWAVEPETGQRIGDSPEVSFEITGDGEWGPFAADGETFYEFALETEEGTHHVFTQRFVRSNRWVHVLTSDRGGLADSFWERGDDHQNMVILRNKELWGDQGAAGDSLTINGEEILNEATSPRTNRTIGIFVHDDGVDQQSDLSEPVLPFGVQFLTGVDLFVPAADPPDGTVGVVANPRLGVGPEAVCVPNYSSTDDSVTVVFSNYHRLLNPDGSEAEGHANPTCEPPAERPDPKPEPPKPEPPKRPEPRPEGPPPAPPAEPVEAEPNFVG